VWPHNLPESRQRDEHVVIFAWSKLVVLDLGSIEPLGFDEAVSGVRRRSSDFSNPYLLSVALGKILSNKSLENYVRVRRVCKV